MSDGEAKVQGASAGHPAPMLLSSWGLDLGVDPWGSLIDHDGLAPPLHGNGTDA